jgi:hypothetical protein
MEHRVPLSRIRDHIEYHLAPPKLRFHVETANSVDGGVPVRIP